MILRGYIIEDEIQAIALLRNYLARIPGIDLVGEARDPLKALPELQNEAVDLLFLDINLPNLSGLEFYKSLARPPAVIFTTAYPEYAVEGFDLEAVDYLLKPISFPRFLKACNRAMRWQQQPQSPLPAKPIFADIIYLKSGPVTYKLSWRDILYLEKAENYVVYHTLEKRYLSRQTMSDLEEVFPSYFCRVHKSFAVSLLHLEQVEREFLKINQKQIPIGRTYRQRLMDRLDQMAE